MECDFTTWVTNCSPAGRGFLDRTGPFLSQATPSSSPLRSSRGNRICRHFTWEGGRVREEGGRATIHPFPPRNFARPPASLRSSLPTPRVEGHDDTRCYLRIGHLLASSLLTGEQ